MGDAAGRNVVHLGHPDTPPPNHFDEPPPEDPAPPSTYAYDQSSPEHPDDHRGGAPKLGTILSRSQLGTLPKVRPLVEGVLDQPAAAVLIGAYGTGKSVLAHGLACSIATGTPWLGREVQRRRVLLVAGEGASGLDDRLKAWENAWHRGQPVADDDLTTMVKPHSLSEKGTWQQLTELATAGSYGFIVLDTFSSLAPDADETKDSALVMRHASDLAATVDGTVLLVHHPGWGDSKRARGGYQFEANADQVLILNGIADEPLVSLTRKKVKEGASGGTLWLRRIRRDPSVIFEWADASAIEAPLRDRILSVLDAHADVGATGPQLQSALSVDDTARSGFYAALRKLRTSDHVRSTGQRQTQRYYLAEHAPQEAT